VVTCFGTVGTIVIFRLRADDSCTHARTHTRTHTHTHTHTRSRAASFSFDPEDLDVPLADSLLLQRSKHIMNKCHDMLDDGSLDVSSANIVSQLLEVLEHGTERGKPVAASGARLQIDAPQIVPPPRYYMSMCVCVCACVRVFMCVRRERDRHMSLFCSCIYFHLTYAF